MGKLRVNEDFPIQGNMRIIRKMWKVLKSNNFPDGIEFAIQLLTYKEGKWLQIARIDNQLHQGKPGSHIHIGDRIVWENLTFEEAEEKIHAISKRMISGGYK